jgi:hypothetical protein
MSTSASTPDEQIVQSSWQDQAVWSETANQLKAELTRWRKYAAIAGVAGAALTTLAASLAGTETQWEGLRFLIALSGAVLLAVVPFVMRTKASEDRVREWVRARSASEALKETIYRYLVKAPPFGLNSKPKDLIMRRDETKNKVRDLAVTIINQSKIAEKKRPLTLTIDEYDEQRVKGQIEKYYLPKGQEKARAARRLHNLEFGLGLLAVMMGAAASAATSPSFPQLSVLGSWVAVVTTAGATVAAYLTASRYDHEAMIYNGTADRLKSLHEEWQINPNKKDPIMVSKFVDDCEHAISTENESWLAEWTREKAEK